jgi:hypothetical protein
VLLAVRAADDDFFDSGGFLKAITFVIGSSCAGTEISSR